MKLHLLMFALISAMGLRAAETLPLFYATMTVGKDQRFVLVTPAGKASNYLRLGDSFDGYALKAYDAKASMLDVERDGRVSRLSLVPDAAVKPGEFVADQQILAALSTKLAPSGALNVGGKWLLSFGSKNVRVGSKFTVTYQGKDYELELVAASPTTFTLRYGNEEFTRPFRAPEAKR